MQVIVDSILTHYVRQGKGKVVVVLHGWGDSAAGLRGICSSLSKRYDVIAIDLPGFGATTAPEQAWGLSDYVTFVQHFLQKIHVGDTWAFVGHSNGGAMVIRGLASGQFTAERAVLIASAGIRNVYKGRNKALRIITKTGKLLSTPLPASIKRRLRRKVYQTVGSDMLVAEHLQETFKRVVSDDVRQDAAKLSVPTLLIYGEADEATPIWYGQQFHQLINGSTLEVLPGAGHFVHLERPAQVEKAIIKEFL